jgi:acetoin utilization deacetylase AcuC-like enzyme
VRFFFPDVPDMPLPEGHRFPASKYRLLRDLVVQEKILGTATLVASPIIERATLLLAHDQSYVDTMLTGTAPAEMMRRIGLPWSETLIARSLATVGGSMAAARAALQHGIAGQLAGGTHHAHRNFGSGYCVFNDLATVSLALIAEGRVDRIAIVDLDVHQGDGNSAILTTNPNVFVLSIHGEKNFPFRKVPSDLDVALANGTDDRSYLLALTDALAAVVAFRPELVLYLSGVDPLAADTLGHLSLTPDGLMERDRFVFETFHRQGIPLSIAIGGGYAKPIGLSVEAYANTFRVAREVYGF